MSLSTGLRAHPHITLASLAGIIPVLFMAGGWVAGFIAKPGDVKDAETRVRDELKANVATVYAEINKNKREFDEFKASYMRESAGVFLQLLDNKVYVARNRVNDCNIARARKTPPMSAMEHSACEQYDDDYREAKRRFEAQQSAATQAWRTR